MPLTTDPSRDPGAVVLSVILPADLGDALDRAAGECLTSRAGHARRIIAAALRESGHLAPLLPPRRHRVKRRSEAA
jgi:hypothetical protein